MEQTMKQRKRLIDANAIANGIADYLATNAYLNDTAQSSLEMVALWVCDAPTVDAVEVVHGRWIDTGESYKDEYCQYKYFECSACKYEIAGRYGLYNYCPNCGARMDGDWDGK